MIKFLLILILVPLAITVILSYGIRILRELFFPSAKINNTKKHPNRHDEILYRNDDIIIFKGDAGKNEQKNEKGK